MVELMGDIGVQLAVPGNHEYDFGPAVAAERFRGSSFKWLRAKALGPGGKVLPSLGDLTVMEVGGVKLGFMGLLTPETEHLSSPGPGVRFADPATTAEAAAARLRGMGADLVVALTHLDFAEDRALAARVKGVDIVLGGHDHDPMTVYEGGKLIVKAGSDLHYLAAVDVTVDRVKGRDGKESVVWRPAWRYESTAGVAPDPDIQAVVAKWESRLGQELGQVVGTAEVELDTRRSTVRGAESNFGDLVADAVRAQTNAQAAIINGGNIRGDRTYPAGTEITRKDVTAELPFGNVVVLLDLDGKTLWDALESGVAKLEDGAGRFPQVSGLSYTYDPGRPVGQRILDVKVGGEPLRADATYRVATNDYMAGSGDDYGVLTGARRIIAAAGGRLMTSAVMGYVAALGGKIAPGVEGRIVRAE